jgi:membrane protein
MSIMSSNLRHLPARIWIFTRTIFHTFFQKHTLDLGAALSYYTMFSIVPLLVVIIGVSGLVAGREAMSGQVFGELQGLVGADTAKTLEELVGNVYLSGKGVAATIIGVITLLIGSLSIFGSLQTSLNLIWNVKPRPQTAGAFLLRKLVSFSFVFGMGFLLVITFVLNSLTMALGGRLAQIVPEVSHFALNAMTIGLSFAVTASVFASLFKFLPHARITWRDVWPGAIFTTVLFGLGKYIIAGYFSLKNPASAFGAAAGLITLLLWTFYSSQVFFLGAVFVEQWARDRGNPIAPTANARLVEVREVEVAVSAGPH